MKPKPKKPRNSEVLPMILHYKGGAMRDRRLRRPKDTRRSWQNEDRGAGEIRV